MKMRKNETMSEGMYAAPYEKESPAEDSAENSEDSEAGEAVYEMFCELSPEEKSRVLKMCQSHVKGEKKMPRSEEDDREFAPVKREDF